MTFLRRSPLELLAAGAIAAAFVCLAALGLRTLTSEDLGYHLAYGEQFLDHGVIVDHNPFLYTLPPLDAPAGSRPAPGPGCWYDDAGRYRFPNANWLSQVLMAAVFRLAGVPGLCLLTVLLVVTTGGLMFAAARRLGVPATPAAAGLILWGLVSFSRLNLRPELFGYAILALEMFLLAKGARASPGSASMPWRTVAALVAAQILFVNLHSYFLLGAAIAAAPLAESSIRWLRSPRARDGSPPADHEGVAAARLLVLQAGMWIGSLLNPWTWRISVLPIETLIYLRANGIGGRAAGAHPWSHILEFRETIRSGFPSGFWGYGFLLVLILALCGLVAAALRRRWSIVLLIAGMTLVSLTMRRNVAAGALVVIPAALSALSLPGPEAAGRRTPGADAGRTARAAAADRWLRSAAAALVLAAAAAFTFGIVTSRFYKKEGHLIRFGVGISRLAMPLGAAAWLDESLPGKRVWCDMRNSSNLHFFTHPHREVPILGNTWAYPPAVMAENRRLRNGEEPFPPAAARHGVDAALLNWEDSLSLALALAADPQWAVVQIEGENLLFIRATGDQERLARESARRLAAASPTDFIRRYEPLDPFIDEALSPAGQSLVTAGLYDQALAMFQEVVDRLPDDDKAWRRLGYAYAARGARRRGLGDAAFREDLAKSEQCFAAARRLDPKAAPDRGADQGFVP